MCDQSAKRFARSSSVPADRRDEIAFDAFNRHHSMSFFDGALMSFGLGLISAS